MTLSKDVFKTDQVLQGDIPVGDDQCRFDYNILETAIKSIVRTELEDENASMENIHAEVQCPTFVVATPALNADGPPTLFRSYKCRGYNPDKCTIWEAGRATSAAPTFFKPVRIRIPPPGRIFVDGGLAHNNPSELALLEAQRIWTDARQFCLVSVGTGRQKSVTFIDKSTISAKENNNSGVLATLSSMVWGVIPGATTASRVPSGLNTLKKIGEACVKLSTSSEMVHQLVLRKSTSTNPFSYYRFNVERDMDEIGLQEWEKMDEMGEHTVRYMAEGEGEQKRDQCVHDLMTFSPSSQPPQVRVPRVRP